MWNVRFAPLLVMKMIKYTGKIPQNINFAIKASVVRDMLEVKSIDYETASSKKERKAVDIFDQARQYTVLIECPAMCKHCSGHGGQFRGFYLRTSGYFGPVLPSSTYRNSCVSSGGKWQVCPK